MYAFTFEAPASTTAAAQLIAQGGKLLAGGQSLLPSMRLRLANPEKIVDLNSIAELAGIRREGNALVIGAMTRHADVAASGEVKAAIPALADLAAGIGDRQVRARGTLGGSVANNDPAACYPSAVLGLGATVITNRREIAAARLRQTTFLWACTPPRWMRARSSPPSASPFRSAPPT